MTKRFTVKSTDLLNASGFRYYYLIDSKTGFSWSLVYASDKPSIDETSLMLEAIVERLIDILDPQEKINP